MTFFEFTYKVLKESKIPLTYKDIWDFGVKKGWDKKLNSTGKTPWQNIGALLYTNVNKENPSFKICSKSPTTFQLIEYELKDNFDYEIKETKTNIKERDLHQFLTNFLAGDSRFLLHTKTIFHEISNKTKKGQDKWLYPDMVGVYFPKISSFQKETLELFKNINKPSYKIYSFELKVDINNANLKEYYFQAVSNSSWANEGYLVIFNDIDDEDVISELVRLNVNFGIGVITINIQTQESKVILQAREKELDIKTIDLLVKKNKNYKDFIKAINENISLLNSNYDYRINISEFDKVLEEDDFNEYIQKLLK